MFRAWGRKASYTLAKISPTLMNVAQLKGDCCRSLHWIFFKRTHTPFPSSRKDLSSKENLNRAKNNQRVWLTVCSTDRQNQNGRYLTCVPAPTPLKPSPNVHYHTVIGWEENAHSCFHSLISGQSPAPCTQVIWIHCSQSRGVLKCSQHKKSARTVQ